MSPEKRQDSQEIQEDLLEFIQTQKNLTGNQLILYIREKYSLNDAAILEILQDIYQKGELEQNPAKRAQHSPPFSNKGSFSSMHYDLWFCFLFMFIAIFAILFIPENAIKSGAGFLFCLGAVRLFFGAILIVFLPGYMICTVLWPKEEANFDRIVSSLGLSVIIVPLFVLGLNYVFVNLAFNSLLITIASFTLFLLFIATYRRSQEIPRIEAQRLKPLTIEPNVSAVPAKAETPIEPKVPAVPAEAEVLIAPIIPELILSDEPELEPEVLIIPKEAEAQAEPAIPELVLSDEPELEPEVLIIPKEAEAQEAPEKPKTQSDDKLQLLKEIILKFSKAADNN